MDRPIAISMYDQASGTDFVHPPSTTPPQTVPSVIDVAAAPSPPTAHNSGGGVVVKQVEPSECEVVISLPMMKGQ